MKSSKFPNESLVSIFEEENCGRNRLFEAMAPSCLSIASLDSTGFTPSLRFPPFSFYVNKSTKITTEKNLLNPHPSHAFHADSHTRNLRPFERHSRLTVSHGRNPTPVRIVPLHLLHARCEQIAAFRVGERMGNSPREFQPPSVQE